MILRDSVDIDDGTGWNTVKAHVGSSNSKLSGGGSSGVDLFVAETIECIIPPNGFAWRPKSDPSPTLVRWRGDIYYIPEAPRISRRGNRDHHMTLDLELKP